MDLLLKIHSPWIRYGAIALFALLIAVLFQDWANAAQDDANTLTNLMNQNNEIDAWWEKVWVQTFRPGNTTGGTTLSDYFFNNVCRIFLYFGLIFWIAKLGMEVHQSGGAGLTTIVVKMFVPGVIAATLLANNAQISRDFAWAIRQYSHSAQQGILQTRILDIEIAASMKDVFSTQVTAAQIAEQANFCSLMPHPNVILTSSTRPTDPNVKLSPQQVQAYDYLECLRRVSTFAKGKLVESEQASCSSINGVRQSCAFLTRFLTKSNNSFTTAIREKEAAIQRGEPIEANETAKILADSFAGITAQSGMRPILASIQYWAVSFMEMALFIDALIAPAALSVAMIPARLNMTAGWLISILTIILAQIINAVLSGVAAMQLSQSATYFLSDTRFEIALGLLAPMTALSVIGGGGLFAAKTFMSTGAAGTGAIISFGSSLSTSVMIGVSRAMSRKQ